MIWSARERLAATSLCTKFQCSICCLKWSNKMFLLASSGTGCSRNTALLHPWSSESFSNLIWLFVASLVFCKRTASISLLFSHRIVSRITGYFNAIEICYTSIRGCFLLPSSPDSHITIWGRDYEMAGASVASNATSGINYRHVLLTTPTANKFIFFNFSRWICSWTFPYCAVIVSP